MTDFHGKWNEQSHLTSKSGTSSFASYLMPRRQTSVTIFVRFPPKKARAFIDRLFLFNFKAPVDDNPRTYQKDCTKVSKTKKAKENVEIIVTSQNSPLARKLSLYLALVGFIRPVESNSKAQEPTFCLEAEGYK